MSSCAITLIIGLLSLLPTQSLALDFDKEIARQKANAKRLALELEQYNANSPQSSLNAQDKATPGFTVRLTRKQKPPIR